MNYSSFKRRFAPLLLGGVLAAASLTPAVAAPRWEHHGGWNGGHERHDWGPRGGCCRGGGGGIGVGGVLLGLGVGAVAGAALAAPYYAAPPPPPPPVYYGY